MVNNLVNIETRNNISEINEEAIVFDNPSFDNSIIGMTEDGCVVYSLDLMIQELANEDGISEEEALEFIDYNTIRSIPYAGEYAPVILDSTVFFTDTLERLCQLYK